MAKGEKVYLESASVMGGVMGSAAVTWDCLNVLWRGPVMKDVCLLNDSRGDVLQDL